MKQKDIALIMVIVFISAIFSFFVSKAIFAPPKNRTQKVVVVAPISTDFPSPDSKYYNSSAFDPTKTIVISQNNNPDPFKSGH